MEMSRQRMRASVLESTMSVCPHCNGTGYVRSPQAVALHLLRSLEEQLTRNSKFDLSVKTPVDTALYLLNKKRETLTEMEERFGVSITIEADNSIGAEMFSIDRAGSASRTPRATKAIGMGYDVEGEIEDGVVDISSDDEGEPFEDVSARSDQEDDEGRSRKRRRRRRGGKGRDRSEGDEAGEIESAAQEAGNDGDDEEGRNSRKRRRRSRGKRGGRNRRDDRQRLPAAEPVGPLAELIASQAQAEAADPVEEDAQIEAVTPVETVEAELVAAPEAANAEADSADDAPIEINADSVDVEADDAIGDEEKPARPRATESNLNLDVEPVVVSSANGDGDEEDKPKKRAGWWSRRSFF